MIGQDSLRASASLISFTARFLALARVSSLSAPGWTTTPSAPIPSPTRSAWVSESRLFRCISRSFAAGLIR